MEDITLALIKKASWVRGQVLEMIVSAGKGHIGGAFSCVEILVALYYSSIFRFGIRDRHDEDRDRFILSKGHGCAALYPILADLGYFPISELDSFNFSGLLSGHPDRRIPGVEADTGSLGHGLGIGAGLALAAKIDGRRSKTIVLLGDGECLEGSVWEAAAFAAHHKMDNLIGIIDNNSLCSLDLIKNCLAIEPLDEKWRAFGWEAMVINGHSFEELIRTFKNLDLRSSHKPLMIIAKTVKGKGVSFMENNPEWHHKVPGGEYLAIARKELMASGGG